MNKAIPSKEVLQKKYIDENKPIHKIAKELGMSVGKVFNYIKKYNIPTRDQKSTFTMQGHRLSQEQCMAISKRNKGRKFSQETKQRMSASAKKGGIGHKKKRSDGYVAIYFPDHPNSSKDGYVMEHILVMECVVGRRLHGEECVHHKNGKRNDNRIENLQLMTKSEHMRHHMKIRWEEKRNA